MTRPTGDVKLARDTVDRVIDLMIGHPELNEYKHTSVPSRTQAQGDAHAIDND
jgi:hypothetical protein